MKSKFSSCHRTLIALGAAVAFRRLRADDRVIPPAIAKVWPVGMQRGTTATFTLDGRNLSDIKAVIFDSPGITRQGDADHRHAGKGVQGVASASIPPPRSRAARSKPPRSKSPPPRT